MSGTTPSKLRTRLAEKLPEILIEAASIVVALLLALALNRWNEDRDLHDRGATARAAIVAELGENASELESARPKLQSIVARLDDVVAERTPASHELQVNLGLSLLSEAAWRATLATEANRTLDFAWITRVAKIYELQETYLHVQSGVLDQLASIPEDKSLAGRTVAASLAPRIRALSQLADGLAAGYDDVLGTNDAATASPRSDPGHR